jgi:hypothetical protein
MTDSDPIQVLLNTDPLLEAEKLTGKSYKDDDETMRLGFGLHMINSQMKQDALSKVNDTHWSITWLDFSQILADEGFERVLHIDFQKRNKGDGTWPDVSDEYYEIWFNAKEGLLVEGNTWTTTKDWDMPHTERAYHRKINSANLYGNIQHHDGIGWGTISMSSSPLTDENHEWLIPDTPARSFKMDCREGFRHNLNILRSEGTFLNPWIKPYSIFLTHYGDEQDPKWAPLFEQYKTAEFGKHDYWRQYADAVTQERWAMLPEHVRECIGQSNI